MVKHKTMLQSRTKLLEKVFAIMSTFLCNKTISKTKPLRKENPFPQFNVASHKRPGIRLSFEYTTTLLSGEGGEGRTGTATMFRKNNAVQVYNFLNSFVQDCSQWSPPLIILYVGQSWALVILQSFPRSQSFCSCCLCAP